MIGFEKLSRGGGSSSRDAGLKGDIEEGVLHPGLGYGENLLRWGFIRKVYAILAAQILVTTLVSAATVLYAPLNDLLRTNSGLLLFLVFLPFIRKPPSPLASQNPIFMYAKFTATLLKNCLFLILREGSRRNFD